MSSDGTVIVGYAETLDTIDNEAFLWTEGEGMMGLGDLPGGTIDSKANAVSSDGSIVVGYGSTDPHEREAFIWDAEHEMRSLKDLLVGLGLDLTGWSLREARDISSDGMKIVGDGINPDGFTEGWIATLPEPGTLV